MPAPIPYVGPNKTPGGPAVIVAPPTTTYISGTPIQVVSASGVAGDVFYYDNIYWRWYNGQWWRRTMWGGNWLVVYDIPQVFLRIPPGHYMHRVVRYHPRFKKPPVKVRPSKPKPSVSKPRAKPKPAVVKRPPSGRTKSAVKKRKKKDKDK